VSSFLVILGVLLFVNPLLWVWGIVDCARRDRRAFAASGRSKGRWLATVTLFGSAASIGYFGLVRPSVRRAGQTLVRRPSPRSEVEDDIVDDMDRWNSFMVGQDATEASLDEP
jgi:hypothetical protein